MADNITFHQYNNLHDIEVELFSGYNISIVIPFFRSETHTEYQ